MQIETSFTVPVPPEQAWPLLLDVPRIAPCLPGAELTETLGERRYRGRATVKVGPVQLAFAGEAEIVSIDEAARTARVVAKGADTRGRGNASASVAFMLAPDGGGTRVDVRTDLQLVGAVAQYGRAAGLLKEIANQLVKQFSDNLRAEIGAAVPAAAEATREAGPPASPEPMPANRETGETAVQPPPVETAPTRSAGPVPSAGPKHELSALALLWAALKAMAGRWLGRRNR